MSFIHANGFSLFLPFAAMHTLPRLRCNKDRYAMQRPAMLAKETR